MEKAIRQFQCHGNWVCEVFHIDENADINDLKKMDIRIEYVVAFYWRCEIVNGRILLWVHWMD